MMRRLAAGLAAAAVGATMVATAASPALADPGLDPDVAGGRTSLSLDVNPEPARKGRPLHIEGKLSVQCQGDYISGLVVVLRSDRCQKQEGWHRLAWKRVEILFQPAGSGRWEHVDTVRTGGNGYFGVKVPARSSGTFRAVFEGSKYLAPSEGADSIRVFGHRGHRH